MPRACRRISARTPSRPALRRRGHRDRHASTRRTGHGIDLREAANLVGHGVHRIALQPGGTRIVAATTAGLFEQPALDAGTAWKRVLGAPFDEPDADCSDALDRC